MVEAIRCPSCQTRYGLRPERVRPHHRRAQCFRCGDVFHIDMEVSRLVAAHPELSAPPPAPVMALSEDSPATTGFHIGEVALQAPAHEQMDSNELTMSDLAMEDLETAPEPAPAPAMPAETQPISALAAPAPAAEESEDEETASGFRSAKDAIAKLFADAPAPAAPRTPMAPGLDVEAGLAALESTLGGVMPDQLATVAIKAQNPEAPAAPGSATLRLSAEEMRAVMQSQAAPAAPQALEPAELGQEEVTQVVQAPAADPNLLRLNTGDQVYSGLSLETLAQWAEEGRVLENHQVARQFSENWIEASKVPGLRPVFERLRRARIEQMGPPPAPETGSMKRSLFGGLFGKKE